MSARIVTRTSAAYCLTDIHFTSEREETILTHSGSPEPSFRGLAEGRHDRKECLTPDTLLRTGDHHNLPPLTGGSARNEQATRNRIAQLIEDHWVPVVK